MFHRKIHPENSIAEKELKTRNNKFSSNPYGGGHVEGGLDKDNRSCLPGSKSKDQIQYKTSIKLPQYGLRGSASSGNREHWIKTDADCKYKTISNIFFLHLENNKHANKQQRSICDLYLDIFLGRKKMILC